MSEFYGPFSSGAGATFSDTLWREFFANFFAPGIIKSALVNGAAGGDLAVTAVSPMNIQVAAGVGVVYGFFYENDGSPALNKAIANGDPTNPRIDRLCIELLFASKTVVATLKQGTPAPSPTPPALTQNATTWDVPVAQIQVPANATSYTSLVIVDERVYTSNLPTILVGPAAARPTAGTKWRVYIQTPFS